MEGRKEVICLTCLTFLLADEEEEEPVVLFLSFFLLILQEHFLRLPPFALNDCQPSTHLSGDGGESFTGDADKNSQLVGLIFKGTISSINQRSGGGNPALHPYLPP